ncbi:hypothetical protein [Pedobacter gandavensis]|uniref:Carboxypeptidase regulatory-like domain-containing protein n=1 Tax=Pedobacter gandavensis TaxID=2679963 RepID=A0ABR6EXP4_9SPHI|nr:hypothetical protein [Pedobacter gandavensis]MBB2149594.1 hypothetical protein [Pedobacter gandavensis]
MVKYLFLFFVSIAPLGLWAQSSITGAVYDFDNKSFPMQDVLVRNLDNKKSIKTKAAGQFSLPAKVGDLIEFSHPGFHTDTLYLIDLKPKIIYLPVIANELKGVEIKGAKVNPDVLVDGTGKPVKRIMTDGLEGKKNTDKAGGLIVNLGYGKMKREREKIRFLEERDAYETEIRNNFNEKTITELVKLDGQELKDFIVMFRPNVALVMSERPFNYKYYIAKAYNTWKKLPADQRKLPPMPKL